MSPPEHECYEQFTYLRFVDKAEEDWVDLTVQDLTETVGHSKEEKRLLHVTLKGPGDMKFMQEMAMDYLGTFYYPIQGKTSREGKRINLPRVDQSTLGWLPLLQGGLHGALTYYKIENEQSGGGIGGPTCTPHLYVINPKKPDEILYVAVVPALHALHDHDDKDNADNNMGGMHNHPHPDHIPGGDGQ